MLKRPKIFLSVILLVAAVVRLYHLGFESFWVDEIYAFRVANKDLWTAITYQDVHPPLYYTIIHFWMKAFGESEVSLRSFSVIFGLLGVWLIYRLGKTLFGAESGRVSAWLLALSVFHITYSQEARSYAAFAFISLASFYFMVRLFQKGESRHFLRYFVATLLMLYTHNFAVWAILFQNAFTFSAFLMAAKKQKFSLWSWIACQTVLFLVYLPWFMTCLINAGAVKDSFWIGRPTVSVLKDTLFMYAGGGKLFVLYVLGALILLPRLLKERFQGSWALVWCFGWLIVTLAIPYGISLVWTPLYYIRYTIASSFPFYLLVGFMLANVRPKKLKIALLVLISVLSILSVVQYHGSTRKEQWRQTVAYVDAASKPQDMALFHLSGNHLFKYYTRKNDCDIATFPLRAAEGIIQEQDKMVTRKNIGELEGLVTGRNRVWLIVSHSRDKDNLLPQAFLDLGYREIQKKYFRPPGFDPSNSAESRQISVTLYEK